MSKTFEEISHLINKHCEDRGWNHEHPNALIASIVIELGELAEHFQWKEEIEKLSKEEKQEIGYEFVDVFFYLVRLAGVYDIDIEKYFFEKLPKLEKKFPIGQNREGYKKVKEEYRETGKNKTYN